MVSHANISYSYIFARSRRGGCCYQTGRPAVEPGGEKRVDEISSGIFGMELMISGYTNIFPSCGIEDVTQHGSTQSSILLFLTTSKLNSRSRALQIVIETFIPILH